MTWGQVVGSVDNGEPLKAAEQGSGLSFIFYKELLVGRVKSTCNQLGH